jgi:hypothetical protein
VRLQLGSIVTSSVKGDERAVCVSVGLLAVMRKAKEAVTILDAPTGEKRSESPSSIT